MHLVALTFESVDEILKCDLSNESYCECEQYLSVVLFIEPYKVVLTFGSLSEFLKCDQCIQTFPVVLSDCVVKTRRL